MLKIVNFFKLFLRIKLFIVFILFVDEEKKYSVVVDIRKFSQFLNCDTLNLSKLLCHVVENLLLHCSIEEDEYVLHYFLSGIDD